MFKQSGLMAGNRITLLRNGTEYFPAITEAIHGASVSIDLQTYIFEADTVGMAIGHALTQAAQRGVCVRVLLDGFGSKALPPSLIETLEQAGVDVMFYRPKISPWSLKKSRLRRLHRKTLVIDQRLGFLGGINIIDDNNVPHQAPPRVDYAVKIEGPLVGTLCHLSQTLWQKLTWLHFRQGLRQTLKQGSKQPQRHQQSLASQPPPCAAPAAFPEGILATLVIRDNVLHRRDIEKAYLSAIHAAKSDIIIANAYFLPNKSFRDALIQARQRGVQVTLLLQGRVEYFYMFATRALYRLFLHHGITIYEYRKSFMHSKVAVIDQHWATVGSSNLDPFSLLLAHEANIVVHDTAFATAIWQDLQLAIQSGGEAITVNSLRQQHLVQRILSWMAYSIVKLFAQAFEHEQPSGKAAKIEVN
jgi:cardiolipin synthase